MGPTTCARLTWRLMIPSHAGLSQSMPISRAECTHFCYTDVRLLRSALAEAVGRHPLLGRAIHPGWRAGGVVDATRNPSGVSDSPEHKQNLSPAISMDRTIRNEQGCRMDLQRLAGGTNAEQAAGIRQADGPDPTRRRCPVLPPQSRCWTGCSAEARLGTRTPCRWLSRAIRARIWAWIS